MLVTTVVGARPQFVKAAAVSQALRAANIEERMVHTGQHYDPGMSDVFFQELSIPDPAHHLGIGSGSHGDQTGRMLIAIEKLLQAERPDWLMVYGDTNSTIAGALAAAKLGIPVAHVEAGLRSFNRAMPEELNRIATDHLSTLLLTPTPGADQHLANEGIPTERIVQVGDVMCDAAITFGQRAETTATVLADHNLNAGSYALLTAHRAENVDDLDRLTVLVSALEIVSSDHTIVCPLHPRTRKNLINFGLLERFEAAVTILPPQGFLNMLALERGAAVIATDSGGVQKEAFFAGTPCVTLRTETEWVELIELGWNTLAPLTDVTTVSQAIQAAPQKQGSAGQPYGDGRASERIAQELLRRCP